MKRSWVRALGLAGIFALLAAAAALSLAGTVTVGQADNLSRTQENRFYMLRAHAEVQARGVSVTVPAPCQFDEFFQYGKGLRYNLLLIDPDGNIQYKMNDSFISGDTCGLASIAGQVFLIDPDTRVAAALYTDDNSAAIPEIGTLSQLEPGDEINVTEEVNVSFDEIQYGDSAIRWFTVWLYDDNTKAYLESDIYAPMRARGKLLQLLAVISLGLYWLLLALWVFFNARRLGRRAWPWAALTLLANIAGFFAYIIARSQGFAPARACPACGRPMHRGWARCPHCGETEESGS